MLLLIIILVLTIISGYVLPWWAIAIIAFLVALWRGNTSGQSFWAGFGGVFIAWMIIALIKSIPNDHILATRVSHLFHVPNWIFVLIVTAIIGGLVGGMSALSGQLIKKALTKK
jgi:hypothetical protein